MDVTITSTPSAIRDESSSPDTVTNRKRRSIWKTDYALYEHRNTFMKVQRARKLHRTDIKPEDWDQEGYALTDICERLHVLNPGSSRIDIIDAKSYSPKNFLKSYVAEERPCIIKGAIAHWPAIRDRRWTMEELCKRFKHVPFKVGSDDYGRKIRMEFKYFADYCRNNHDDSPLYLFESGMMCRGEMTSLLDDYEVPREWFPEDIFALAGRDNRPPYRWFSVGPARSGTTVHKDPLGTHAWNALVTGTKRWVLLPPKIPEGIAKGRHVRDKDMDDEAVQYFDYMIPRIIAGMDSCEGEVYEAIQEPGDVIFVPGNWWHGVVNLNTTVAVTQNFVCSENFEEVWMRTRKERPKLSQRWRENIFRWAPELARRVAYIDENLDGLWRESLRKYAPGGDDTDSSSSSSSSSSSYSSSDTEGDIEWDEVEMKHSVGQRRPADTMTAVSPVEDVCMEHTCTPNTLLASVI